MSCCPFLVCDLTLGTAAQTAAIMFLGRGITFVCVEVLVILEPVMHNPRHVTPREWTESRKCLSHSLNQNKLPVQQGTGVLDDSCMLPPPPPPPLRNIRSPIHKTVVLVGTTLAHLPFCYKQAFNLQCHTCVRTMPKDVP